MKMSPEPALDALLREAEASLATACSAVPVWSIPGFYYDREGHLSEKRRMEPDAQAAYTCALAYRVAGAREYARKAAELLDGWATVNREIGGHDGPLVSAYLGVGFIRAAIWLEPFEAWSREARERFAGWLTRVCLPAWEGIEGRNNWWDWSLYARLALHRFTGDDAAFGAAAEALKSHIEHAVAEDGFLPEEAARGANAMWYHYFALAPMTAAAKLVLDATGEDLFRWTSPGGKGIKRALDTFLHYADGRAADWPFGEKQNVPAPLGADTWPVDLFEAMAIVYRDEDYARFAAPYRPVKGHRNASSGFFQSYAWNYPSLWLEDPHERGQCR
ncbi:alginate lyase family protein [Cohnella rhizosphaerae]|uniref:Alginate lyase family protein n=1 Tax=Cohnella rhizosphaerae TaxID=1457232 RepID=A0A9X4L3X3_9BACL|nr:alginate lyase family protein [Cohnella rhizosphaerae]MDG0813294.1 alginate lyase family protein [Cohnella rhizosphaerae]